jgi:hypothetical protein
MDILNSPWLIKMLAKSSKTPCGRLLSLFDTLEDWLDAPNIAADIRKQMENCSQTHAPERILLDFLTLEASKAGAAMPEMLASQLYFMAVAATQEKLQVGNAQSLRHARSAANALISAQTKTEFHIAKPTAYAMAASFAAVCVIAGGLLVFNLQQPAATVAVAQMPMQTIIPQMMVAETIADPQQTAALIAQIEQMRHGNCQLIEAVQLPDSQKGIYLNMVVNGQVSTNPQEQAIAFELLARTRCNYTPMLMANSTG